MSLPAITAAAISFNSAGDNIVVAKQSGKAIWVWQMYIVLAGASNITIVDGTPGGTNLTGAMPMLANGAIFQMVNDQMPWFKTSRGNDFVINNSNAVQVSGAIYYSLF